MSPSSERSHATSPRVALVTGASSGIGKATAAALVAAGFTTYATARRVETLAELQAAGCETLPLDVTSEESMVAAIHAVEAAHGGIDVLVNNAGYGEYGPLEELALENVRREFETNVFGLLRMCQLVLPGMRERKWGRIINVSSMGGEMSLPAGGAYHASKYAVEALSDVLRAEVAAFGVAVSVIQPGGVRTNFATRTAGSSALRTDGSPYARMNTQLVAATASDAFQRFWHSPEDIARVIVRAAQATRPHTRYKISVEAHLLPALRLLLPDRGWDALVRRLLPV